MEPLQETFTVRTRDGREYPGLTLASLRIGAAQKIFSLEDVVRSDQMVGTWTPIARVLSLPDPSPLPSESPARLAGPDYPQVSTGIALDLEAHPAPRPQAMPMAAPLRVPPQETPYHNVPISNQMDEEEGPVRHRLRIAGAYLLFFGILGMVAYAFGKHGPTDSIIMLVNTGFGIALLMNFQQVRKWAAGWVVAGWVLAGLGGTLAAGCFGLVIVGVVAGLGFGGPACLLWGEECPRSRFWTGVTLIGIILFLLVVVMIIGAVAGATLAQRMRT